jgi:hypothetical protein
LKVEELFAIHYNKVKKDFVWSKKDLQSSFNYILRIFKTQIAETIDVYLQKNVEPYLFNGGKDIMSWYKIYEDIF